jgi:hydroxymethylpyrimidine kinase/phosphomethylpyrimidine kinase/thiamine-phosphate diphosphorylase
VLREPVVAIAGMDAQRSHEAMRCGAAGVAVLRGIVQADDPERVMQGLQAAIDAGRSAAPSGPPDLPRSTCAGAITRSDAVATWQALARGRSGNWQVLQ